MLFCCLFFFKQKTAYEMRISDWSSDVCSSDLYRTGHDRDQCLRRGVRMVRLGWRGPGGLSWQMVGRLRRGPSSRRPESGGHHQRGRPIVVAQLQGSDCVIWVMRTGKAVYKAAMEIEGDEVAREYEQIFQTLAAAVLELAKELVDAPTDRKSTRLTP